LVRNSGETFGIARHDALENYGKTMYISRHVRDDVGNVDLKILLVEVWDSNERKKIKNDDKKVIVFNEDEEDSDGSDGKNQEEKDRKGDAEGGGDISEKNGGREILVDSGDGNTSSRVWN